MSTDPTGEQARRLVAEARAADNPTAWFERLYAAAADGAAVVPWDRGAPHPALVEWAQQRGLDGAGRDALVVGCGLGADAEYIAGHGFDTVAFDIAPSAVSGARARFPGSRVRYVVADLLDPPADWREAFDLVVESLTVQSLPDPPRGAAIARIAGMVAPGGTLLVIASRRDEADGPVQGPPWPLIRAEVEAFAAGGLRLERIEALVGEQPDVRRWRAELRRPPA
jgi:SAM-dependent methyltransferase